MTYTVLLPEKRIIYVIITLRLLSRNSLGYVRYRQMCNHGKINIDHLAKTNKEKRNLCKNKTSHDRRRKDRVFSNFHLQ